MAYSALIDKQLSRAFSAVKDLAVEATFVSKEKTFDFESGLVVESPATNFVVKVVILKATKTTSGETIQVLFKNKDLLPIYTSVVISGVSWKLSKVISSNKKTTLLELTKWENTQT
jgi:hypothetical protein